MAQKHARWLLILIPILLLFSRTTTHAVQEQRIFLEYAAFDPLLDGEPAIPGALRAAPHSEYALLQLTGPLQEQWRAYFATLDVRFYGYLPQFTYLVKLTQSDRGLLEQHPAVRWIGPYHPAYKLSPVLSSRRLALQLFADADPSTVSGAVSATGAIVLQQGAGYLLVDAAPALVPILASIEEVSWIQNAAQMRELNDDARWVSQGNTPFQTPLYARGLTGAGQVGAIADSGLAVHDFGQGNISSCFFLDDANGGAGGVVLPPAPEHRKVVAYTTPAGAIGDTVDGSGHGSHVVGSVAGDRAPWNALSPSDGQAFDARIYFQDIGIGGFPLGLINPPSDYRVMFGEAYDGNGDGVYQPDQEPRTHSNSWGSTEPIYSLEAMQTDEFMWTHPDYLIFFAAGNQGPGPNTIGQPATAKSIVTVGGTENGLANTENMGYFSSHGPAPLGRLKPTISAPGDRVTSAAYDNPCGTAEKIGTSMATPTVHGITLLMRQYLWDGYYPSGAPDPADRIHPSAALLKAMLINSGRPMTGNHTDNDSGGSWPSNGQGWGRVTADDVLYLQGDRRALWLHDEYALDGSAGFSATGETRTFSLQVADGAPFNNEPLAITLAWSDFPGLPAAGGALVNDLNLTVTGPDGAVHMGNDAGSNDFSGAPDLPQVAPDAINPWEMVYLANPQPGVYTVRVTASTMASPLLDAARKQGFAVVATGDLVSAQGRAEIEFPVYEGNGHEDVNLRISDLDLDLNSQRVDTVTAQLIRDGALPAETVTLTETASGSGVFAAESTVAAAVTHLELRYADANDGRGAQVQTSDYAVVERRPRRFGLPPQALSVDNDDGDGTYSVIWQAVSEAPAPVAYIVQEATAYDELLADDAETSVTDNWTTGQANAPWSSDGSHQHSGSSAYWSGRGDTQTFIDSALTLRDAIVIPPEYAAAQFGFYSHYYNDANDYGHVEIAVDGGPWQPLRRFYADPRVPPLQDGFTYHEFDLDQYAGRSIRVRFRYDNGVASIPPDSAGWWLDDIIISAGDWQTVASTESGVLQHVVTGKPAGHYYYRVRALFADGSVSGWSQATDVIVETSGQGEESRATGGGWLADDAGGKINFSLRLQQTADGPGGQIKLNDRRADVKIHLSTVTAVEAAGANCGGIPDANNALSVRGHGTYNGAAAEFRLCLQDNAEPGAGSDLFYLTCTAGCNYASTASSGDVVIDGGNIQIQQGTPGGGTAQPATMILDPVLLTEGVPGQLQLFSVSVYDSDQLPLAGAAVRVTRSDGATWTVLSGADGVALFNLLNLAHEVEYTATIGTLSSNSVTVAPLFP